MVAVTNTKGEAEFAREMQENPNDFRLRRTYADFLDNLGDPRGELLRLTCTLTQSTVFPNRPELEARLQRILKEGVQSIGPFWTNRLGIKFAWVPPGMFLTFESALEKGRLIQKQSIQVTLTRGFFMGVEPITQEVWRSVTGANPSHNKGQENLPVDWVSWYECQEFIRRLTQQDRKAYRLPTEAEWEYACRAGTTTPFYFGESISHLQANCRSRLVPEKPTPVGSYPPNSFGLRDMHGNISEWCQDWFGDYPYEGAIDPQGPNEEMANLGNRVYRGGCFAFPPLGALLLVVMAPVQEPVGITSGYEFASSPLTANEQPISASNSSRH